MSTKIFITTLILFVMLIVSVSVTQAEEVAVTPATTPAAERSLSEIELLVAQLMEQVKSLQAQLQALQKSQGSNVGTPQKTVPGTNLKEYDVEVLENVRVRSEAGIGMAQLAVKQRGMKGVVIAGPIERNGMQWYKIKYNDGTEGWSAGQWLRLSERAKIIKEEIKDKKEAIKTDVKDKKEDYVKDRKDQYNKATSTPKDKAAVPVEVTPVVCTMDAFQCPNGEFVGRSGPKCQFMCPVTETSRTTE